jgi:hypothetical protein
LSVVFLRWPRIYGIKFTLAGGGNGEVYLSRATISPPIQGKIDLYDLH